MFVSAAVFVALRTFVQIVCDDYVSRSGFCENLLKKAFEETLSDIRSAYFLKVIEADNNAVASTFTSYHIGFLAYNTTYASEAEIIANACKMPYVTREFLSWTAGVLPLFVVYVLYKLTTVVRVRFKRKPMKVVEIQEPGIEMTEPTKDTPPRTPLYVPRDVEPDGKPQSTGIRRRQVQRKRNKEGPSVIEKLTALSPSLKKRIMQSDPMV